MAKRAKLIEPKPPAAAPAPECNIRISPFMEREYKRRGVFPELRLESAINIVNGATGVYGVTIERAREVLTDAETQCRNFIGKSEQGTRLGYSAIVRNIKRELDEGAQPETGLDELEVPDPQRAGDDRGEVATVRLSADSESRISKALSPTLAIVREITSHMKDWSSLPVAERRAFARAISVRALTLRCGIDPRRITVRVVDEPLQTPLSAPDDDDDDDDDDGDWPAT